MNGAQNVTFESLLEEMGAAQGYSKSLTKTSTPTSTTTTKRHMAELDNYPDNQSRPGSSAIWNPLVSSPEVATRSQGRACLPTNPLVEVLRRRAFETFKANCRKTIQLRIQQWNTKTKTPIDISKLPIPSILEQWHMDVKQVEERKGRNVSGTSLPTEVPVMDTTAAIFKLWSEHSNWIDPILILSPSSTSSIGPLLLAHLHQQQSGQPKDGDNNKKNPWKGKMKGLCKEMGWLVAQARDQFSSALQAAYQQELVAQSHKSPKISHSADGRSTMVTVSYAGLKFSIHATYYEKLQRLWDRAAIASRHSYSWPDALFCVLCRYDMLQGAGLQAGIPGSVFDVLLKEFDVRMECFASPLNCRYERYGSAFGNGLDRLFGSQGSCFDLDFARGGCFQANPPFSNDVLVTLAKTIHESLNNCPQDLPLMFVVVVPVWSETAGYNALVRTLEKYEATISGANDTGSSVNQILLRVGDHYYTEGTQHRRKAHFRPASFDTHIMMYQNKAARKEWPITQAKLNLILQAFREDPSEQAPIEPFQKDIIQEQQPRSTQQAVARRPEKPPSKEQVTRPIESRKLQAHRKRKKKRKTTVERGNKKRFRSAKEEDQTQRALLASLGLTSADD